MPAKKGTERKTRKPIHDPLGNFGIYAQRINKKVNAEEIEDETPGMTAECKEVLNNMIIYTIDKLGKECDLIRHGKKGIQTLTVKVAKSATKLALPEKLAKHAMSKGNEAVVATLPEELAKHAMSKGNEAVVATQ